MVCSGVHPLYHNDFSVFIRVRLRQKLVDWICYARAIDLTVADGNRSTSDPNIACGSGSCKLRSPILSMMKSKDPKTNLESGKNLVADSNAIDLT
jgi:hypothetical protein